MTSPKVSIVIPAYNHEAYLECAVSSAISQTYKSTEIILLNDGSTDSTGDISEKLAKMYPTIRYCSHSNIGAHNTINKGINLATGQYIAILNSDDIFYPDKIERCVELVRSNKALELISGNVGFIDSNGVSQTSGISVEWQKRGYTFYEATNQLPLSVLNENIIATTSNMFFTKEIWQKVGGFQPLRYCHDLDFLMSAYRTGIHYFDKEYSHIKYRVHEANTIKENISKIRIEIAAVIAVSLVLDNTSLLNTINSDTINYFTTFLNNKNMSNLIILMIMEFIRSRDRAAFYDRLYHMEVVNTTIYDGV